MPGVLINITGGSDMTLFEVDQAARRVQEEVHPDANIIFGSTHDDALAGTIRVSIVAAGIDTAIVNSVSWACAAAPLSAPATIATDSSAAPFVLICIVPSSLGLNALRPFSGSL